MVLHRHLLLTLSVLLLFSILAVRASKKKIECEERKDPRDKRKKIPDRRDIFIESTRITSAGTDEFSEIGINFKISVPIKAMTVNPKGTGQEECYIDYHGPSAHNNNMGSVGSVWCKDCLGEKNIIKPEVWNLQRDALTRKLRELTDAYMRNILPNK